MLKGVLIKGAPSLGTKFNPNFKDPHHAPLGNRPQSRGLTQGNIIQIASKALAVMGTPQARAPRNLQAGVIGSQPYRAKENRTSEGD